MLAACLAPWLTYAAGGSDDVVGCWCTAGPNPVASLLQHINPLKLVPFLRQRARQVTKLVWQAEDLAVPAQDPAPAQEELRVINWGEAPLENSEDELCSSDGSP